jgi:PBSX family phage terminase large subunit
MALSQKAYEYLITKPNFINLLDGSVSSSKTVTSLLALPERFTKAPTNGETFIIGKTERTVYRNVISPLIKMHGQRTVKYSKGMGEGRFGNRSFFVFGAHNERAEDNVRGLTAGYFYADEAPTFPQTVLDMAFSRLRVEGACCDLTGNPGPPGHYINQNIILPYLEGKRKDVNRWHFTLEDNPNLPKSYLEFLKNQYPVGSLFYKRNILGLWVLAEGTIYSFFDESLHRLKELPKKPFTYIDISCDYGTSNATSAGIFGSYDEPHDGLLCCRIAGYEHSGRDTNDHKTDLEYINEIIAFTVSIMTNTSYGYALEQTSKPDVKDMAKPFLKLMLSVMNRVRKIIVDPSALSFKVQWRKRLAELGAPVPHVTNAENEVLAGIQTQARMLKTGQYKIGPHKSNDLCVQDYAGYIWNAKAQERGTDEPLKTGSHDKHSKDGERYYVHTVYGKR